MSPISENLIQYVVYIDTYIFDEFLLVHDLVEAKGHDQILKTL